VIRALWRYGPAAAWAGLIFFLSSLESPPGSRSVPDWISHGIAYLVLSALLCRALHGAAGRLSARTLLATIALATAYGITDELHQRAVPGRDASVADVGKDFVGAALGAVAYARWRQSRGVASARGTVAAAGAPSGDLPARRPGRR